MRIALFCIGTRPDMIKMAPLILECRRRNLPTKVVHIGQHYDENMDGIFSRELEIPQPDVRFMHSNELNGKSPGWVFKHVSDAMGDMLDRSCTTSWVVVVYGDTWGALAASTAAYRRGIDVVHVEAGLRSYDLTMPEEVARVQMDTMASFHLPPTQQAVENLANECMLRYSDDGTMTTRMCGNLIVDSLKMIEAVPTSYPTVTKTGFALLTLHRPENVDDAIRFRAAVKYIDGTLDEGMVAFWPVHPRAAQRMRVFGIELPKRFLTTHPIGYADMIAMMKQCRMVITDSGGLQEEACILGKPCVTIRKNTERPETIAIGANVLVDVLPADGGAPTLNGKHETSWEQPYGTDVAKKMADVFEQEILK